MYTLHLPGGQCPTAHGGEEIKGAIIVRLPLVGCCCEHKLSQDALQGPCDVKQLSWSHQLSLNGSIVLSVTFMPLLRASCLQYPPRYSQPSVRLLVNLSTKAVMSAFDDLLKPSCSPVKIATTVTPSTFTMTSAASLTLPRCRSSDSHLSWSEHLCLQVPIPMAAPQPPASQPSKTLAPKTPVKDSEPSPVTASPTFGKAAAPVTSCSSFGCVCPPLTSICRTRMRSLSTSSSRNRQRSRNPPLPLWSLLPKASLLALLERRHPPSLLPRSLAHGLESHRSIAQLLSSLRSQLPASLVLQEVAPQSKRTLLKWLPKMKMHLPRRTPTPRCL